MKPHLFFFCIYLCFLSWVGWLPTAATPGANSEPFALPPAGMVFIPGGTFLMGGDAGLMDGGSQSHRSAYPIHEVQVDPFWMDQTEVTNRQFSEFVDATGYVTFAERPLPQEEVEALKRMAVASMRRLQDQAQQASGAEKEAILASIERIRIAADFSSSAGSMVFTRPDQALFDSRDISQWWRILPGATWRAPEGPGSTWVGREDHPVVNVTREDAAAYADWAGKRLPTEAEWERAARGGLVRNSFAWGEVLQPDGEDVWMANIWQGAWPYQNTSEDGYESSSPVRSFPPNPFGLFDISGNVWEIVSDHYDPYAYGRRSAVLTRNPTGPNADRVARLGRRIPVYVTRGGSFLCSDAWCRGYQPGSRQPFASDSPANHIGFRCVKDIK